MKEEKQKFSFGDIVRHKETGALFVTSDLGEDEGHIAAMCKENGIVWSIEKDKLEPIPHPDTVRLDWLLKQPNYTYPDNGYDDEGEPIKGVVLRQEYNMGDSARVIGHGKDARAAIDDAMQHEANHE